MNTSIPVAAHASPVTPTGNPSPSFPVRIPRVVWIGAALGVVLMLGVICGIYCSASASRPLTAQVGGGTREKIIGKWDAGGGVMELRPNGHGSMRLTDPGLVRFYETSYQAFSWSIDDSGTRPVLTIIYEENAMPPGLKRTHYSYIEIDGNTLILSTFGDTSMPSMSNTCRKL